MLATIYRLSGRLDDQFFRSSLKQSLPWGVIHYQLDSSLKTGQHTVIVPKKQFASSVKRHQAKRQLHALLAPLAPVFKPGRYVWVLNSQFTRVILSPPHSPTLFFQACISDILS